jgi:hypothetical protein
MSMNVHLLAEREIWYKVNGEMKSDIQKEFYDLIQTRTEESYAIVESDDPLAAYIKYAKQLGEDQQKEEPVYAEDDIFCVGEPIGYEMRNPTDYHVRDLQAWVDYKKSTGWEVEIIVM